MVVYLFKVTLFDNAAPISIFQDEGDAGIDITVENKTVFYTSIQLICIPGLQV